LFFDWNYLIKYKLEINCHSKFQFSRLYFLEIAISSKINFLFFYSLRLCRLIHTTLLLLFFWIIFLLNSLYECRFLFFEILWLLVRYCCQIVSFCLSKYNRLVEENFKHFSLFRDYYLCWILIDLLLIFLMLLLFLMIFNCYFKIKVMFQADREVDDHISNLGFKGFNLFFLMI